MEYTNGWEGFFAWLRTESKLAVSRYICVMYHVSPASTYPSTPATYLHEDPREGLGVVLVRACSRVRATGEVRDVRLVVGRVAVHAVPASAVQS
jgi:hypothetical protein